MFGWNVCGHHYWPTDGYRLYAVKRIRLRPRGRRAPQRPDEHHGTSMAGALHPAGFSLPNLWTRPLGQPQGPTDLLRNFLSRGRYPDPGPRSHKGVDTSGHCPERTAARHNKNNGRTPQPGQRWSHKKNYYVSLLLCDETTSFFSLKSSAQRGRGATVGLQGERGNTRFTYVSPEPNARRTFT
jgi:hypothetical protein